MSFDFSLIAQLNQAVRPLMASKTKGESIDLVASALKEATPKTIAQIAKEIGRAESNVSECLKALKAKIHDKKGPKRAARWVMS